MWRDCEMHLCFVLPLLFLFIRNSSNMPIILWSCFSFIGIGFPKEFRLTFKNLFFLLLSLHPRCWTNNNRNSLPKDHCYVWQTWLRRCCILLHLSWVSFVPICWMSKSTFVFNSSSNNSWYWFTFVFSTSTISFDKRFVPSVTFLLRHTIPSLLGDRIPLQRFQHCQGLNLVTPSKQQHGMMFAVLANHMNWFSHAKTKPTQKQKPTKELPPIKSMAAGSQALLLHRRNIGCVTPTKF